MKHLLERCDIEDEDKLQEITDARTFMKKNKYGNMCMICNQRFAKKMDGINIFTKSTRSSGANIVTKFAEIERGYTVTEELNMETVQ